MNDDLYNGFAFEIKNAIEGIAPHTVPDSKNSTWTRSVKEIVGQIGINKDFRVCASGFEGKFEPEWLYDLVWYRNNPDVRLETVPLVLESEWLMDYYDIRFDFEKLLLANAPIKVMVFQNHGDTMEDIFSKLTAGITEYAHGTNGIYLLACYRWDQSRFEVRKIIKALSS